LLALGLGGLLGINETPQSTLVASPQQLFVAPAPAAARAEIPEVAALRTSVQGALAAQVRADLDDAHAQVTLRSLDVQRASVRTLELHGEATVALAAGASMPLDVVAAYDLIERRMERVEYTARPQATRAAVADDLRRAISIRIGARLAAEFRDQPARFELLDVERIDYGYKRLRLEGAGLTDFGAEGVVYTPFVAILDKRDGELVELSYELLHEPPAGEALAGR
jgi:hypothetical protein